MTEESFLLQLVAEFTQGATADQLFHRYWPRIHTFEWVSNENSLKLLLSEAKQIAEDGDPLA
ncbi:hypothetical protein [Octadecabacter sp. R77987]|uniref:hypothetical protein n=1 Tax=Octadecabacter sp. R77987 TaxID=3093874 RepID=UPI003673056B